MDSKAVNLINRWARRHGLKKKIMGAIAMKNVGLLFLVIFCNVLVAGQGKVFFIEHLPEIDGQRPGFVSDEMMRPFMDVYKSDESLQDIGASYFLGHTSKHLYVFIEADADSIVIRDRAYQNGDGFHFTIGFAKEGGASTDEFYVFGFSPANDWTNKIRWYYNVDLSMRMLGDGVRFETGRQNGKTGFELLMPWADMPPYHPWIYGNLGFNLCFVKAVNDHDRIYYFIKTDERMQSEQSERKYVDLHFEAPAKGIQLTSMPVRHNVTKNDDLEIHISGYSEYQTNIELDIHIVDGNGTVLHVEKTDVPISAGFNNANIALSTQNLEADNYFIQVYEGADLKGEHLVSVFDKMDLAEIRSFLSDHKDGMAVGTYNTLLFYLLELENERHSLKYYEASGTIAQKIKEIDGYVHQLKANDDPLSGKTGKFRRAFVSETDHTLRPYSIYVPGDFDPEAKYPLLVYLHGSGQDDRALFSTSVIEEGFIVVAPNGRGTSNCFATPEALIDIREAIDDVRKNYPIDDQKIILSGFSMGGYGVYRTFYEYPGMFNALAILSGHPDLASKWGIENPVNFLDKELIRVFSDVPVFIYHGKQDLNCPYELTLQFVNLLEKNNRNIVFLTDAHAGHDAMNAQIREKYFRWLKEVFPD